MRKKLKKTLLAFALTVVTLAESVAVSADTLPYDCYNYDSRGNIVYTPAAYVPGATVTGANIPLVKAALEEAKDGQTVVGSFVKPQDMTVDQELDMVVIADTDNNRIVVLNEAMTECSKILSSYDYNGEVVNFKKPQGVYISVNAWLYVADSENQRVVAFDINDNYKCVRIVENPQSEVLGSNFNFVPLKVLVDAADRLYVINKGETTGIMKFDTDGKFSSFFGTIEIQIGTWEKIWRRIRSQKQSETDIQNVATEFTGMDIDPQGFVYATNRAEEGEKAVRRLNPKGEDVIRKGENGVICGDIVVSQVGEKNLVGPSIIQDIVYRYHGIYSIVDSKRGRVFTYDKEGNLLYIFGGKGAQDGTFMTPSAIEAIGDRILVLDAGYGSIIVFEETEYGRLINDAVSLRDDGDETQAVELWKQVLKYNENFELANAGIGKAYLTAGDNVQAMKYLKLGMSREYYSIAYKRYRNEFLKKYLNYILTGLFVFIIAIKILISQVKKRRSYKKMKGEMK